MSTSTPKASDPVEVVPVVIAGGIAANAAVVPTQVRRPWKSTIRTVFQAFIGLCVLAPLLVNAAGLDPAQLPWLGVVLGVAAAVTRIMALPGVEAWLQKYLRFLSAASKPARRLERGASAVEITIVVLLALAALWLFVHLVDIRIR